jgi:hypothetical protein
METTNEVRVMLLATSDPYTSLTSGSLGTKVGEYVDPWGYRTVMVKWDNGSNLSLIEGSGDSWREITNEV